MSSRFERLPARILVALVAIPVIVWAALSGGYFFFVLVAAISTLALSEWYAMAAQKGAMPLKPLGFVMGVLVNGVFIYERLQIEIYSFFSNRGIHLKMFSELQLFLVLITVLVVLTLLVVLFRTGGSPLIDAASTLGGVLIVSLCFGLLIAIRELFPYGFPVYQFLGSSVANEQQLHLIDRWGGFTILAILASIWICDTAAYFVGGMWGRHKLFERVSPGKSWEGAAAGFLGAVVTMLLARSLVLEYLSIPHAVVLGMMIGVFGQVGDLVESRFKRDAVLKDSSHLIPGHGGVYDRFDSLVFLAPIVYLYIDFVVLS